MASSDVLSQTLHSITNIKLDQLSRQKSAYETAKTSLLSNATSKPSSAARARVIAAGGPALPAMNPFGATSLPSITRLLDQAAHDPSVAPSAVEAAERTLRNELDVHSEKYRFAELYGRLVNEWIASGQDDSSDTASDSFVPLGRAEMHAQRATWERYVFEPLQVDTPAITSYLTTLFLGPDVPKAVTEAFTSVRDALGAFQDEWDTRTHFTETSLESCIRGLLRSDLLSDRKRATLSDFLGNAAVLREMADVLNMRMQTRASWAWDPSAPAAVEQRRSLNGRYRFYPDEDLLQAVLLYYIGRAWGVEMRARLLGFMASKGVMRPATREMDGEAARRWSYFVGPVPEPTVKGGTAPGWSVEGMLEMHFRKEILLDQLPVTMDEKRGKYDGDEEEGDTRKSPVQVVQELLRFVQSVLTLRRGLGEETAVVRSDFTWFGPSLPHASVFAVLSFLGVRPEWVGFFRRALECPLQFGDDTPGSPARIRRRGLPLSTPLADLFAESLLFCLDYAVNRKADGARLYRLHDDMWLFGTTETCAKAWSVVTDFSALFGLSINEDKTGSVVVRPDGVETQPEDSASALPSGAVTWGFLRLDAASGRFLVDQTKVDTHITELRLQLASCRSVFDWIQAWNIYGVRFFQTNLGGFAQCHGRAHVDEVLATFRRIQDTLFPGGEGVAGHIRAMLAEKFDAPAVLDGCLFYPPALGGLGLLNPFVAALSRRPGLYEDAGEPLRKLRETEARQYDEDKGAFENVEKHRKQDWHRRNGEYDDLRGSKYMEFEEFVRHRERTSRGFGRALAALRMEPEPEPVERPAGARGLDAAVRTLLAKASEGKGKSTRRTRGGWEGVPVYDQWVVAQHAQEMESRFGGVTIVERGLLPMGLIDMLRQSRFKWQT
jgi:hypothetical protein